MTTGIFYSNGEKQPLPVRQWRDLIRERGYQGFIFDCDGAVVESSEVHLRAFQTAAQAQGFEMHAAWYLERTGLDRFALFQAFAETVSGDFQIEEASAQSILAFINDSASVRPIEATQDLIKSLSKRAPLIIGTNAEQEVAEASLRATALLSYFQSVVSISDGLRPKPACDIFTEAAERLGKPLNEVLVFEDSNEGVQAALAAKLEVIQLVPTP